MTSLAFQTFEHAIQDAIDLLNQFDSLNRQPPPPEAEVLKRASLVMALAALETYVEDRVKEAVEKIARLCNIFSVKVSRRVHWAGWIKGSYSSRFFRSSIPRRTRRAAPKRGAGKKADWGRSKPRGFCV